ncbi:3-oxoadipate enol-lactonase [Thalassobaculum sp.]|uniref:3-oxoadipate enol-lactonase n=1 Tax=Thalassobaculum sp. TaxID=2022740 RepID=UPI0032EA9FE0
MQAVTIDGTPTHYAVDGPDDAPALVFANSLGTDFRIWDGVLARLEGRFRTIRYDMRGHGLTGLGSAPYGIPRLAADLDALLDHLGVKSALLCGLSIGGLVAQQLVRDNPSRVRALVLCDTAAKIGTPDMWQARIAAIEQGGLEGLADAVMERWFAPVFRLTRREELAVWRNMLVRTPAAGYAGACAAIRDADLSADTARIAVPTLVVCGADDGATPPAVVKALADGIPGAHYREIPEAGHLPCVEQPEALVGHMLTFFKEAGLV